MSTDEEVFFEQPSPASAKEPTCVEVYPQFLTSKVANGFKKKLFDTVAWSKGSIAMFGKVIALPRLTAWYGDHGAGYVYSGVRNDPLPWTVELEELRDRIVATVGGRFNSVLLNLYRHGYDSVSWHSDDEPELGQAPFIASLSFGATRDFNIRKKGEPSSKVNYSLSNGSLIVMSGPCQRDWEHEVPKKKSKNVTAAEATRNYEEWLAGGREGQNPNDIEERINLTFRWVDPAS